MKNILNKVAQALQEAAAGKKPILKESDRSPAPAPRREDAELVMSQDSEVCEACGSRKPAASHDHE